MDHLPLFLGFNAFVVLMLALDLFVFNRKAHEVKLKEALLWTGFWVSLAALFAGGLYLWYGDTPAFRKDAALDFTTAYLVELALSVDNLFVFLLIFSAFQLPNEFRHRVLFWGILGAILMRVLFIFAGVALLKEFHLILYAFGGFLIFTGIKMAFGGEQKVDLENGLTIRLARRFFRFTGHYEGDAFFTVKDGIRFATPLFLALLMVEVTDVVFALDSIPAVLAISDDFVIVYTSNIFAILGLRSLFFALAGVLNLFRFLKYGLAFILSFVGLKMMTVDLVKWAFAQGYIGFEKINSAWSLAVIAATLVVCILLSLLIKEKKDEPEPTLPSLTKSEEAPQPAAAQAQ